MQAPRRIHVLINPASGQDRPILAPLNRGLSGSGIDWDVSVLQQGRERDAVTQAVGHEPELVVVYGGDGTVAMVATTLLDLGSKIPLLPLPGGTANALALYLGVPVDLELAMELLKTGSFSLREMDVGLVRGKAFFLRVSLGFAAELTHHASREQKDALGVIAYALSTLQAVRDTRELVFRLTVDGVTTSHSAIACIVANSEGTGLRRPLASDLDEADAKLDALLIPDVSWAARALANAASGAGLMDGAPRRSGRKLLVDCDEPVPVHADGEHIGSTPVEIEVRPRAMKLAWYQPRQTQASEPELRGDDVSRQPASV